jgi:hypothetical protein
MKGICQQLSSKARQLIELRRNAEIKSNIIV